ncbi:MAG: FadR/GntR family transcriptional regulator [Sphaerochaetaceae bacterium]
MNNKISTTYQEPLRVQIAKHLENEIKDKIWKVGTNLPTETKLCERFKVSRITIRAALQAVESLGYIRTIHGSGSEVISDSPNNKFVFPNPFINNSNNTDIIAILEYRKIIEKGIAGLAAERITESEIEDLEAIYKTMLDTAHDLDKFSCADLQFHKLLCKTTKNPVLFQSYESMTQLLEEAMSNIVAILGSAMGLRYHKLIISAMKSKDKEAAEKIMEEHIQVTIDAISDFYAEHLDEP